MLVVNDVKMTALIIDDKLRELPLLERMNLVEELWDSIAFDQNKLPLTLDQKAELDRRLALFALHKAKGPTSTAG